MSPLARQTGIFYLHAAGEEPLKAFPKEFRRRLLSTIDRDFAILLAACGVAMGGLALLSSLRELPADATDKEIQKIQERYAQLVLNQPKPKKEERKVRTQTTKSDDSGEKDKIDRKKETYAEKTKRREQTREDRQRRREAISRELQSAGIFAAITAVGGGTGPAGGVSDLLGATDVVSGLEGLSVSSGTFATRNVDPSTLTGRRGERTTGVGIAKQQVGSASARQIASAGSVKITSEPPKITGDEAQVKGSQACIQAIINREKMRIKRVYETWLKRDPKLSGRTKLRFTILPSGDVADVKVVQSTTNNTSFDQNVVRYVSRWKFTKCQLGSPLEIELPVVFEGQS